VSIYKTQFGAMQDNTCIAPMVYWTSAYL